MYDIIYIVRHVIRIQSVSQLYKLHAYLKNNEKKSSNKSFPCLCFLHHYLDCNDVDWICVYPALATSLFHQQTPLQSTTSKVCSPSFYCNILHQKSFFLLERKKFPILRCVLDQNAGLFFVRNNLLFSAFLSVGCSEFLKFQPNGFENTEPFNRF